MTIKFKLDLRTAGTALLLAGMFAACGSDSNSNGGADGGGLADGGTGDGAGQKTVPTVLTTNPADKAVGVALNRRPSATFSQNMDPSTINALTFTVTTGAAATPVLGAVTYGNARAVFTPTSPLTANTLYTANVGTGAKSAFGIAIAQPRSWTFTTGDVVEVGVPVVLNTAGNYAILAKSAISTVPTSKITGHIAVSPAAASYITGFSLTADASNQFATSLQVIGRVYAADYTAPTPSNLTTAVNNMETAFTDAAGRAPDVTELGAGNIGGMTLQPGVYKWGTGLLIPTNVTLTGSPTDVWIFQIAQNLTVAGGAKILLSGGALPRNIFWQIAGAAELGTTAHLEGVILSQTSITLRTGASINGRLLAQTAISLDSSTVVAPAL